MTPTPISLTIETPARNWAGSSLVLRRQIGQFANGTVTVQPITDSGKLTGEEVRNFATSLNTYIRTRAANLQRDIRINLTVGNTTQEISGFLTGCSVATSAASAATTFDLNFVETNLPLNSMSLGCYRIPPTPTDSAAAGGAAEMPFYGVFSDIKGTLGQRIGQIYRRAQEAHVSIPSDPFDEVMERQRTLNTSFEFAFAQVLLNSNWNLPWLAEEWLSRPGMSENINAFLAQNLISQATLWQALLNIARTFHLEYRGDPNGIFGPGGFGLVDPGEAITHDLSKDPVSEFAFQVGSNMEQPLSQVIVTLSRSSGDSKADRGGDSAAVASVADTPVPAAVFPPEPFPALGKTLILRAPSFMVAPFPRQEPNQKDEDIDTPTVRESIAQAVQADEVRQDLQSEFSKGPLTQWARSMFIRESTRHLSATIAKPLELGSLILGARTKVSGSTNGVVQAVTINVQVAQNSGHASLTAVCTNLIDA